MRTINVVFSGNMWTLYRDMTAGNVRTVLDDVFKSDNIVMFDDIVSLFDIGMPQGILWKTYNNKMKEVSLQDYCPDELIVLATLPDIYRLLKWESEERDSFEKFEQWKIEQEAKISK